MPRLYGGENQNHRGNEWYFTRVVRAKSDEEKQKTKPDDTRNGGGGKSKEIHETNMTRGGGCAAGADVHFIDACVYTTTSIRGLTHANE